jgi:hypothetical protein
MALSGKARSFLTEVRNLESKNESEREEGEIREATQTVIRPPYIKASGSNDVFKIIDQKSDKQNNATNLRSIIQKAAQKTIMVVRAKNSSQAADNVAIRFYKHELSDVPRAVQLKVLRHKALSHLPAQFEQHKRLFKEIMNNAPELDNLLKDMFWYVTSSYFQPGKHPEAEEGFYHRIAETFTSIFMKVQSNGNSRNSSFFYFLPDAIAQILFIALYEAFPRSRKAMDDELRRKLLHLTFSWLLGYIPAQLDWSHWASVNQDSPTKKMSALTEFPAMRNRAQRVERIEKTKQYIRSKTAGFNGHVHHQDPQDLRNDENFPLESIHGKFTASNDDTSTQLHYILKQRVKYQISNSPLVQSFLKRHKVENNMNPLKVRLHMSNGNSFDINQPKNRGYCERRRLRMSAKSFSDAVQDIEKFGESVRVAHMTEKRAMLERDAHEKKKNSLVLKNINDQFQQLQRNSDKIHEYGNILVSRSQIEKLTDLNNAEKMIIPHRPLPRK